MENLAIIIVPLILTGLGFITYNHPSLSRHLLKIIQFVVLSFMILFLAYYYGRITAISEIQIPYIKDKLSIDKSFDFALEYNNTLFKNIFLYYALSFIIISVFYYLSLLFEKIRNPKTKE